MTVFRPESLEHIKDAVAWAADNSTPLEITGSGTKRAVGRTMQTEASLDLSGLAGITLYEPEELVLSAWAGTLRSEAEAALKKNAQQFAFEPPDLSRLLGTEHAGTLAGMTAANLAGPRRIKAGAARDHFLGFHGVSGRGEIFRSGGRVVKNVTGYDLSKVLAGSWGTLAVMSSVTYKVLPAPETQKTVVVAGLDDATATSAMAAAMKSSCEVSGAAHLPAGVASCSAVADISAIGNSATVLRLEGIAPSVEFRKDKLIRILSGFGESAVLEAVPSSDLWTEIRDVHYLASSPDLLVWRISVPPMDGQKVLAAIGQATEVTAFYDWAGGLIWAAVPVSEHGSAEIIRGSAAMTSGHATLIRAPAGLRAALPVFQPQPASLAALSARLKQAFDPKGILNPGRMYP